MEQTTSFLIVIQFTFEAKNVIQLFYEIVCSLVLLHCHSKCVQVFITFWCSIDIDCFLLRHSERSMLFPFQLENKCYHGFSFIFFSLSYLLIPLFASVFFSFSLTLLSPVQLIKYSWFVFPHVNCHFNQTFSTQHTTDDNRSHFICDDDSGLMRSNWMMQIN